MSAPSTGPSDEWAKENRPGAASSLLRDQRTGNPRRNSRLGTSIQKPASVNRSAAGPRQVFWHHFGTIDAKLLGKTRVARTAPDGRCTRMVGVKTWNGRHVPALVNTGRHGGIVLRNQVSGVRIPLGAPRKSPQRRQNLEAVLRPLLSTAFSCVRVARRTDSLGVGGNLPLGRSARRRRTGPD